ncbi:uncharacterized protein BDW43DRAFT_92078 [Aspergillus alliaceus]|uniref:uncharacterized protein n=1 Tax=Petromyces alliaceus TaxID=209559 RepID=UPI0012A516B8|nr:uncharacterized protein BDW43DRAFT_92078 [Aspergillus alliaceus]KAB8233011.1 hypothetical protein BDW43DRAFT_92078 [Aspergillus alliaceus]
MNFPFRFSLSRCGCAGIYLARIGQGIRLAIVGTIYFCITRKRPSTLVLSIALVLWLCMWGTQRKLYSEFP